MCTMSMVGDHYRDKWFPTPNQPSDQFAPTIPPFSPWPSYPEFEELKKDVGQLRKDVEEMKKLLLRAKIYDEENDQADCEIEEKIALLRKVAEMVGISLDDVLGPV